jgi:hypothetical protein
MDKLEKYQEILRSIILRYAKYNPSYSKTEWLPICDDERGEYLLVDVGWENEKRTYLTVFHFRIKDGKIYVEQAEVRTHFVNRCHCITYSNT